MGAVRYTDPIGLQRSEDGDWRQSASGDTLPRRSAQARKATSRQREEKGGLEMAEPYHADHIGSLLRPPRLLQARAEHAAGRLGADELRGVEDEAILEVLDLQRQVGIDVY